MEKSIVDFIKNYNIKYDLSHPYINKIFTDLKQNLLKKTFLNIFINILIKIYIYYNL